ncbi:MAG: divergent polysaccharide deacetylase family protein [Thermodesulfobacteriota bacterium]|nr:divergent polysaccharide deacetylase family protein [Thermodesulfobacteriota bacterium]
MTIKKKKTKQKKIFSSRDKAKKTYLKKAIAGLSLLVLLVLVAGFLAHHILLRKQPVQPAPKIPTDKIPTNTKPTFKTPVFEIYPKEDKLLPKPDYKPKIRPKGLPKVAIIIDDIGYERRVAEKFLGLDVVLTFSVFPHAPFQQRIIREARAKGLEIMLHLPMEPDGYPEVDPGPDALLTSMSPDELIDQLNKNLDAVPLIKGVNNHMGSKITTESTRMYQIFSVLKKRGLFFVDSRTTPESICKPSARLLQVPFAERDVFLDHVQEPDFIRRQIKELIRIAEIYGTAVGIAHPHLITYEVFRDELPKLQKKVRLVPASSLVHIIG